MGPEDEEAERVCQKIFRQPAMISFKNKEGILAAVTQSMCRYGILPLDKGKRQIYDLLTEQGLYIVRCFHLHGQAQYVCISRKLEVYPGADRSSIRMPLSNRPGALYKVLDRLYTLGINVLGLESHPIAETAFEGMFYFDLETSIYSEEFVQLMCELDDLCESFCYLGSYTEAV